MVEIEEEYAGKYAFWLDGNETHAGVIRTLTMRPQMDRLGIAEQLRVKHDLSDYRVRKRMSKAELWKHLLAAQVEQELTNAGVMPENFDGFLLKPQIGIPDSSKALLVQGVTPTLERRRITYAQTVIFSSPDQSKVSKYALRSAIDKLDFNISEPIDYDDYSGFEKQSRQFLHYLIEIIQDNQAHQRIRNDTGITSYRIVP